jgi:hypothetical protein
MAVKKLFVVAILAGLACSTLQIPLRTDHSVHEAAKHVESKVAGSQIAGAVREIDAANQPRLASLPLPSLSIDACSLFSSRNRCSHKL